jgi:hypothetical protein
MMVGGVANLLSLFSATGRYREVARQEVDEVCGVVPPKLAGTPCFLDRLTGLWRYDFGEPFVGLPDGGVVFGTHMYQPVDRLFDVLRCARTRLPGDQLQNYLLRLDDPAKHSDLLFEFAPVLRLSLDVAAFYEVSGEGEGNRTIDWVIRPASGPRLAIEVKHRTKDLIESLVRGQTSTIESGGSFLEPAHDANLLFASVEQKFRARNSSDVVQVAWIGSALKQEEREVQAAFARLDGTKVHVAFLAGWGDDVYALAHDAFACTYATAVLGVRESGRFVFNRSEG